MKIKILTLFIFLLLLCGSALALSGYFLPGAISTTTIDYTTSAGTFVKLTSSEVRQLDVEGNAYIANAFEVYELTNTYDIRISWVSNPSAYITWKSAFWGPFQTWMNPPVGGVYVALTFTPTGSDKVTI